MNVLNIIWLIAFVVFVAVEAGSVSLVSVWFALGALAALIVSWAGGQVWLQAVIFLAVSCIALCLLRPLVRKYINPRIVATNVDSVVGSEGIITAAVDNLNAQGEVRIGGQEWTARSTNGQPISEGTVVRVDKIEGVRAFVTPVPAEEKV